MAFDSLSEKLQNVFKNLRSKGRLTEADVKAALKEVKMALLEADVNFKVVKQFVKSVQERAIGADVMNGLNPGQMVIKIVNEEMVNLMGSETTEIKLRPGHSNSKERNHFWLPATFIVRLRSSSYRSTVKNRAWKYLPWVTDTSRSTLQKQR